MTCAISVKNKEYFEKNHSKWLLNSAKLHINDSNRHIGPSKLAYVSKGREAKKKQQLYQNCTNATSVVQILLYIQTIL